MNLNNIDLNKVAVFCQVVDSGTYRAAGDVLNVTPSALSQTISILEHSLGFPLFHRIGRKLVPTENALLVHREFRTYHGRFAAALEALDSKKSEIHGTIQIGAYLEFAKFQLAPVISQFARRHPAAQIKLIFETPTRLHRLLENGQIDLCFSIYPFSQSRTIQSKPVYKEELVLIAPKGLMSANPSYEELMAMPIVEYYSSHQPIRRWLALHYKKKPKAVPIRVFASTAEMVLALVSEKAGIGVVPKFILDRSDLAAAVDVIRPTRKELVDHIWLLSRKSTEKSVAPVAFLDFFNLTFKKR